VARGAPPSRLPALPLRIDGGVVQLRPLVAADATTVQWLAGDARVAAMTAAIPHPYPPGAARAWIATHRCGRRHGDFVYGIERGDGRLVGTLGLRIAPNPHGNVGYWIGRPYWGRGYATAAARAGVDALFEYSGLAWLMAAHVADNAASARVLAKCGMREVARIAVDHRGRAATLVLRRVDRRDWRHARDAAAGAGDEGWPGPATGAGRGRRR
jgi:RimJ/RimL family protein N-acetyltransferase